MTYPYHNPPPAEHGSLYAAVSHRLADQAAQPNNAEPTEAHRSARLEYMAKVKRYLTDDVFRASLSDNQVAWYVQTMRWLQANGWMPSNLDEWDAGAGTDGPEAA